MSAPGANNSNNSSNRNNRNNSNSQRPYRRSSDDPSAPSRGAQRRSLSASPQVSPRGRTRKNTTNTPSNPSNPSNHSSAQDQWLFPNSNLRAVAHVRTMPSAAAGGDKSIDDNAGADLRRRQTLQPQPPTSPSAFSQHSNPLSHQASLSPDEATKLKKWVQNAEHLVPHYEVDDDEHHILDKGENQLWNELFPDDDSFLSQLEQENSARQDEKKVGWGKRMRTQMLRFVKSKRAISWVIIGIVQINAVVLGVCNLLYAPYSLKWDFQVWRICFLVALLPFTWLFGDIFVWLVIKFVERFLFTFPNCLYFTYACKGPLRWVMRFLALTILWACMMTIGTGAQLDKINEVYDYILNAIGCLTLFFTANLLKRLAAKSLALNLNKGKNQLKLEAALRKEKILRILLGPRPKTASFLSLKGLRVGGKEMVEKGVQGMQKSWSMAAGLSQSQRRSRSTGAIGEGVEYGSDVDFGGEDKAGMEETEEMEACVVDLRGGEDDTLSEASLASETVRERRNRRRLEKHELEEKRKLEKQRELQRRKNVIMRLNLLETYIRNHNIKVAFKDELNTASIGRIESEGEAKRVGSFLYWNVKGELTGAIVREDLNDFFLDDDEKELAFTMLDMSGDGQVDLRECIEAVDAVFVDRHNLAATLKDGKAITKTIENLIGIVIHVVFIFFYLLVWEADVGSIWVSFSGIILGFSFIFSRTVSEIFDNVVFLFGTHAYSVGDLLMITESQMVVEEVSLNFTQLRDTSGRTVWMPNQFLVRNAFTNLTTSTNFFASFIIWVDWKTVQNKPGLLDKIASRLEEVKEEHRTEYGAVLRAGYDGFKEPFKVGIKVVFEYATNGTDLRRTAIAKGWMVQAVGEVLVEEGVEYTDVFGRGGEGG